MDAAARFDDVVAGHAIRGRGFERVLVARERAAVVPVLEAVEAAAAAGRWCAGFVSYDAAPALDPGLVVPGPPADLPLVWFAVFASAEPVPVVPPPSLGQGAPAAGDGILLPGGWGIGTTEAEHARAVAAVKERIAAGDTYQVNLTARLRSHVGDPERLHAQLVHAQRPAFGALLDLGDHVVASATPELFFEWDDGEVRCRPMKGTARRGRWPAEDAAARAALVASEKDRAENVMIVDLVRNDLGRVCEHGTVRVDSLFDVEAYPTVWQLTSSVAGRPRPDVGFVDLLRALFPCGSVTGAPKQRTMELIADLEPEARGVYCGAVGWVGPGRRARLGVAIRTAVVDRRTGAAEFGSGGGIVWDSDPAAEWAELRAKASALTASVGGFGLVETLRGTRHLDRHLRRLAWSASVLGFPFDEVAARAAVADAGGDERVRLVLDRSGSVTVTRAPSPAAPSRPVRLAVDLEPVRSTDPLLFHKTTCRRVYEVRRARHPGADDVLLVNERGEVTESTIANLAFCVGGRWWTPPLDCGLLPGIGRAVALEEGRLAERVLRVDELPAVARLALVSDLRGWRDAALLR